MALAPNVPVRLGPYEPLIELASGGMGDVYVARRVGAGGFEHLVVLKRMRLDLLEDRKFCEMLRDEARIASAINHPNAVPVVDVIEEASELVLVMQYVESCSLAVVLRAARSARRRLPIPITSRIACDVLAGLHAAHEAVDGLGHRLEIVHRDVSPDNVLVGVDGSSRVIDFGIAKARGRLVKTEAGESLKGKYGYMAPEQARREATDRRSDVWAAGVVLWEALTCARLFHGRDDMETIERVASGGPAPPPSSVNADVPPALDAVVGKALSRSAADRYETALNFLDELERVAPPASPRQVASLLDALCGQRVADTRRRVQSAAASAPAIADRKPQSGQAILPALGSAGKPIDPAETPTRRQYSIALPNTGAPDDDKPVAGGWTRGGVPTAVAIVALLGFGGLFGREAVAYARYRSAASWVSAMCVLENVREQDGDTVMSVAVADGRRGRHAVDVLGADVERPSSCFGGASPEPAMFSRALGGEVHCFHDPASGRIALRRWATFSLVPLLLLGLGTAASAAALGWARRRGRRET